MEPMEQESWQKANDNREKERMPTAYGLAVATVVGVRL
jgi:hypothetical protein